MTAKEFEQSLQNPGMPINEIKFGNAAGEPVVTLAAPNKANPARAEFDAAMERENFASDPWSDFAARGTQDFATATEMALVKTSGPGAVPGDTAIPVLDEKKTPVLLRPFASHTENGKTPAGPNPLANNAYFRLTEAAKFINAQRAVIGKRALKNLDILKFLISE